MCRNCAHTANSGKQSGMYRHKYVSVTDVCRPLNASTFNIPVGTEKVFTKGAGLRCPRLEPSDSEESHAASCDDVEALLQRHP